MIIDPPSVIRAEARRAASTNEKAEMSIERRKLARVVFSTKEPFSSFLSEKAMAWTRKSMLPKASAMLAKAASIEASSLTSASTR